MTKKQYFEKNRIHFLKAALPKWEGGKYAGGSRTSCFNIPGKEFHNQLSNLNNYWDLLLIPSAAVTTILIHPPSRTRKRTFH